MGCGNRVAGALLAVLLLASPALARTPAADWDTAQAIVVDAEVGMAEAMAKLNAANAEGDDVGLAFGFQELEMATGTGLDRLVALGPHPCYREWWAVVKLRLELMVGSIREYRLVADDKEPDWAPAIAYLAASTALAVAAPHIAREVRCESS